MSKTNSLKGYAVGALVALVSTLFTVAPAQADANGPVTLLPAKGTTFNTIVGSPIELDSLQDPSTHNVDVTSSARSTYYVISNPDKASIKIGFVEAPTDGTNDTTFSYITYDADGVGTKTATTASPPTGVSFAGSSASTTMVITTTLSKIAVSAATLDTTVKLNNITLDATAADTTVNLTVQTLVDYSAAATKLGVADGFDKVSKAESVVIYSLAEVPATTTITSLTSGQTSVSIEVVYGKSINPYYVNSKTKVALLRSGTTLTWSGGATWSTVSITASATDSGLGIKAGTLTAGVDAEGASDLALGTNAAAGIYSAQAYYDGKTVGAASVVWNASAGPSTLSVGVTPKFINTLDANYSASRTTSEILARTGTTTVAIEAQLITDSSDITSALAAANVEVKAVVNGTIDTTSTITITGAAGTYVKGGTALTAFGRTNTDGKASFTITSTTGKKGDVVSVTMYAKDSNGNWDPMYTANSGTAAGGQQSVQIKWEDAAYSTFTAKPANYISGANPNVTFKVADQFGKGIDSVAGKALTVYAEASFGGVAAPKTYSSTVVVSGGEASFTFANFAPAGGLAQLKASLFQGAIGTTVNELASTSVNVYNTAVTDTVAIATSFKTAVSYVDYVTGDTTNPTVAKAVADAGLSTSEGVAVAGNVLNASGVGQPGVAVTVAADGVLFYADGVYSLGTITTNANEFGAFSVNAIAHTVYARGTTVSITADGKSATTLLVTYLPDSIDEDDLAFSWTLPANVVKNTTYAVTLKLTDKWGNPIATTNPTTSAVSVQGLGSVEINSSASAIGRNFDRNGEATVFLRSVKDIAGPGSITATLASTFSYTTDAGAAATSSNVAAFILTDAKATAWDESAWSNTLTSNVEVLDAAPAATGKVNVGSFNGKLVVYARGLDGAKISWKVAGKWGTAIASGDALNRFDRPVGASGVNVLVDIYVNGVKQLSKSVLTR